MITYHEKSRTFTLSTAASSCAFRVDEEGALRSIHWGARVEHAEEIPLERKQNYRFLACPYPYREEYIGRGRRHYLEPCLLPEFADGTRDVRLQYLSHTSQKTDHGEKLTVVMHDEEYPLRVELEYFTWAGVDLIGRRAVIVNEGVDPVTLAKAKSGSVYPGRGTGTRLTYFSGKWGGEYQRQSVMLRPGKFTLDNTRGVSAGPQFVPFFAVDEGNATETAGEVWYGLLHWSGNFRIDMEMAHDEQLVVTAGINDFDADIVLEGGQSWTTPLFTVGYSDRGFEKMSETLFDFQYIHLAPQTKIERIFPIICNSWYPYEMDVNEEKCLSLLPRIKEIGAELFVLDDGWFKGRLDNKAGIGDWECDPVKFPRGLRPIANAAHAEGLLFGLWVEPEMAGEDSELIRRHPEWVLQYKKRPRSCYRYQCVLNLARDEVREFVWETVDRLISEYDLDYLKWDMNAYMTEISDAEWAGRDKEIPVRFIENLYEVWRRMNEKYPNVLFENCAHGGARADFGMIPFSDRINRSDNADPIDVMRIHEGFTTFFLPKYAGGAGNVSPNPNWVNRREVPLRYRAVLGMTGSMSIGIDLLKSPPEERQALAYYIELYKGIRHITQNAYVYRLRSAFENTYTAWEYLNRERTEAVVFVFAHDLHFKFVPPRLRLRALKPDGRYAVRTLMTSQSDQPSAVRILSGDTLMNWGMEIDVVGDFDCILVEVHSAE